jgi:hypothetical protein
MPINHPEWIWETARSGSNVPHLQDEGRPECYNETNSAVFNKESYSKAGEYAFQP